jgi:hypothetical protein
VKGRVNVWVRTDRVEAKLERTSLRRDATRIALTTGGDPEALIREAEALVARARAAGARTREEINAYTAQELGIDPDELQAETERVAAMRAS